jgi:hypothetical protein
MTTNKIRIQNIAALDIKNALHNFSKERRYIWKMEELASDEFFITLFDKKPESSTFMTFIETFASRRFVPDRMRIQIDIKSDKDSGGYEVYTRGEVLMAEMNIVDPDPKQISIDKLNQAMKDIADRLNTIVKEVRSL